MKSLKEMEEYAKTNYVPIIREANIKYLEDLIREHKLYNILELGSAIGYSSIRMALVNKQVRVTTIERDEKMYDLAINNIKDMNLDKQIKVIYDDIFNVNLNDKYDLIFIDAAKAQYIKFFNKFKDNLNDNGYIVSDNLELLDLQRLTQSKRSKRLVEKMHEYKDFLDSLENYTTQYLEIGDGFAITKKRL
jgi:predicted O-methyltransferase YrrM